MPTFCGMAGGDENDDKQVKKVSSKEYEFLVGGDIDPQVATLSLGYELKDYFWKNRTAEFGLLFRLKGRLNITTLVATVRHQNWVEENGRNE
jgi:hypothetical protein